VASDIATALIAAAGGLIVAGASYWFTKKRERDAELRKEKLNHYKELVASIGRIIANESTDEDQREFARASNNLNLVASQSVLAAFREFRLAITN
jgi:LPXTG-motif cell wall-anchored protein